MKPLDRIYLHDDLLVRGSLNREAHFTKAVGISGIQFLNASESHLLSIERELGSVLKILKEDTSLQIQWQLGHDYSSILDEYQRQTKQTDNGWCHRERHNRHAHYRQAMKEGKLRQERAILYLTHHATYQAARGNMEHEWEARLEAAHAWFQSPMSQLDESAGRLGAVAHRMNKAALYGEYHRQLNPSFSQPEAGELLQRYDPEKSLLENCVSGEFLPIEEGGDSAFYYDGHYHAALVLKSLPQSTIMGMMAMLTHLPLNGFQMAQHIIPVDVNRELENEQKSSRKLRKAYQQSGDPEYASLLRMKEARIDALVRGELQPFRMQMIFRLRAQNRNQLDRELQSLKAGIDRFYGASFYSLALPTSLRDYFLASLPGNPRPVHDFYHDIEQVNLSHLLPLSGAATGSLNQPGAIYHSWSDQLISVGCFHDGNPMHLAVVGGTGSGKSMFMIGFLTQTMDEFDFTVIVDDGASYISYVQLEEEGVEPLVIDRNGRQTLNYLDTQGLPYTPGMQADILSVAKLMLGSEVTRFEEAVLEQAIRRFFHQWHQSWKASHPDIHQQVVQEARLLEAYKRHKSLTPEITVLYAEFQHWKKENPGLVEQWAEEPAVHDTRKEVIAELGFAFVAKEQMPTHSDLQGWLEKEASTAGHDAEILRQQAGILKRYCRDSGSFGCLLDGINSIQFDRRVVYVELGKVREADEGDEKRENKELAQLATFILTNKIRNEIVRRPRSQKKRVVLEELGSFLTLPGGTGIVREFMQTMRKYQCMVTTVAQQLETLDRETAKTIKGNISQAILLKPKQNEGIEVLQDVFDLPRSTVEMMHRFEDPSKEKGAPFVHWSKIGQRAEIQVGYNQVSKEMLMVGTTSGTDYERKLALQEKHGSVLDAVIVEAETF